jgi:hypothetical protein
VPVRFFKPDLNTGETNTASNVGVGGVGVFKQKTGVNLEFRNINAGSSKVTITSDVGNNEIDIDVTPGNIDHDALLNYVANEHIDWTQAGAGTIHTDNYIENATHTGEVTGSGALTVDPTAISNKTAVTPVSGDYFLFWDATDSALKKADFDDLGGGGGSGDVVGPASSVDGDIVLFDGLTGKLIKSSTIKWTNGSDADSWAIGDSTALGTGTDNIAIGNNASTSSGNTNQNLAVGEGAIANGGECTALGEDALASGLRSTAIGRNASATGSETLALGRSSAASAGVAIGPGATASAATTGANFALGKNTSVTSTNGASVGIGNSVSITGSVGCAVVGDSATASGAVASVLGRQANGSHDYAICLGYLATSTTTNQMVIGNHSAQINYIEAGKGATSASPSEVVWRTTSGSGTNISGANFVIEPGRPTGSGNSGDFRVRTAAPGASGTTLRTSVDRFFVDTNGNIFAGTAAALATNATQGFLHVPSCAGTPTGVPGTTKTGLIPLVVDSTNYKLYGYIASAWRDLTGA